MYADSETVRTITISNPLYKIQVGPEASIHVLDDDQFLKFGPDGKFIKNLCKEGQGPGEFDGIYDYVITNDTLVVLQRQPDKIVLMTDDGQFMRDFRPQTPYSQTVRRPRRTIHHGNSSPPG